MTHKRERIGIPAARAETVAAVCSFVAAFIHGLVTPVHLQEWWGYGLFFIFAAGAQMLFALMLVTDAVKPEGFGPSWATVRRRVLWAGIVGNSLIIALYLVTRTVGVPYGPGAGEVEPIAVADTVSKIAELGVIVSCAFALRAGPRPARVD